MNRPARRVGWTSTLAAFAVLALAGCGSGAPSGTVTSTPVPPSSDGGNIEATPSPESSSGTVAGIPNPCAVLSRQAIESVIGPTADAGTPGTLANNGGLNCTFVADDGASFAVTIENTYPSASVFNDRLHFGTTEVTGLGEAARFVYTDVGTPPSATLWVYAKGLSTGLTLWKSGLTEAGGLDVLKGLAAQVLGG